VEELVGILKAKRESRHLDFKSTFDPSNPREMLELLKDLVAMANSGGGVIAIGLENDGSPSRANTQAILNLDPAKIADQVRSYTGEDFDKFEVKEAKKKRQQLALIYVGSAESPIVFTKPGTYPVEDNKQRTAFSQGTVYFRHGAKSETATSKDIRGFIDRYIGNYKKRIFGDVRKVIDAPPGHEVRVLPREVIESSDPAAIAIRRVDDPNAPAYRFVPSDDKYPSRQKEVIDKVNSKLENSKITSFDIQAIRKVHQVDANGKFTYKSRFGSRQYSEEFPGWILSQFEGNQNFFKEARERFKIIQRER